MYIKQISVFVENTTGRLSEFTRTLADNGIDMRALCIADTVDFGILRCIAVNPERAIEVLNKGGFTASITKVIAIGMDDIAGGFHSILETLSDADISIKYAYSSVQPKDDKAIIIMKVADIDKALEVLDKAGTKVYSMDELLD